MEYGIGKPLSGMAWALHLQRVRCSLGLNDGNLWLRQDAGLLDSTGLPGTGRLPGSGDRWGR